MDLPTQCPYPPDVIQPTTLPSCADGLVTDRIGVRGVDDQRYEATLRWLLAIAQHRGTANELSLVDRDEAIEPSLRGRVDRPVLARPGAEALFEAQRMQCAGTERREAELFASRRQRFVEHELTVGRHPIS